VIYRWAQANVSNQIQCILQNSSLEMMAAFSPKRRKQSTSTLCTNPEQEQHQAICPKTTQREGKRVTVSISKKAAKFIPNIESGWHFNVC
jgi:hypothetical protein